MYRTFVSRRNECSAKARPSGTDLFCASSSSTSSPAARFPSGSREVNDAAQTAQNSAHLSRFFFVHNQSASARVDVITEYGHPPTQFSLAPGGNPLTLVRQVSPAYFKQDQFTEKLDAQLAAQSTSRCTLLLQKQPETEATPLDPVMTLEEDTGLPVSASTMPMSSYVCRNP